MKKVLILASLSLFTSALLADASQFNGKTYKGKLVYEDALLNGVNATGIMPEIEIGLKFLNDGVLDITARAVLPEDLEVEISGNPMSKTVTGSYIVKGDTLMITNPDDNGKMTTTAISIINNGEALYLTGNNCNACLTLAE